MVERVLVVDNHREMAEMLAEALCEAGFQAEALDSGAQALRCLAAGGVDALVTDLRMEGPGGLDLLARSLELDPHRPVIVMTAYGAIDTVVSSLRRGATHCFTKPFSPEELGIILRRALDQQKPRPGTQSHSPSPAAKDHS
jgi:two-component system response regulator HydG